MSGKNGSEIGQKLFDEAMELVKEQVGPSQSPTPSRRYNEDTHGADVDVVENHEERMVVVNVELPGYQPENVEWEIDGNNLLFEASRETYVDECMGYDTDCHQQERVARSVSRSVSLPQSTGEHYRESFDNGVMTLIFDMDDSPNDEPEVVQVDVPDDMIDDS